MDGGVKAAMGNQSIGIIDNWIRHIKDVYRFIHNDYLDLIMMKQTTAAHENAQRHPTTSCHGVWFHKHQI
jgi:molybdopterin/thiamine biosynthesis adenylyltransferase